MIIMRDTDAVRRIMTRSKVVEVYPVPACEPTPHQIRAAAELARGAGKLGILICEDCPAESAYVVVSLRDLPLLAALLFEELAS